MSANHPAADAPVSRITPSEAQKTNGRVVAHTLAQRAGIRFVKVRTAMGLSGFFAITTGAIVAVSCTAWAIQEGVPYPLAIMVGYCTLACSASLGAALPAIRRAPGKAAVAKREPNYAAWKLVSTLRISDASRLWCDIEPGAPESQESIAWGRAMLDAIKRGELPASPRPGGQAADVREEKNPSWSTHVARHELIVWARAHGHSPRFLQD